MQGSFLLKTLFFRSFSGILPVPPAVVPVVELPNRHGFCSALFLSCKKSHKNESFLCSKCQSVFGRRTTFYSFCPFFCVDIQKSYLLFPLTSRAISYMISPIDRKTVRFKGMNHFLHLFLFMISPLTGFLLSRPVTYKNPSIITHQKSLSGNRKAFLVFPAPSPG